MVESIQETIEILKKFNQTHFECCLHKYRWEARYKPLDSFTNVFLLKDNQVITINPDGTKFSEFENFNKFDQYLGNAVADGFVIDLTNGHVENRYKSPLKNNTLWFSNLKTDEIIMEYVMCYILAKDLLGNMNIEHLKSINIPIINRNDQEILASEFKELCEVIKFLENQVNSKD